MNSLNTVVPLMRREWLQHRFAWALLMGVPLLLSILPLAFAEVQFDDDMAARSGHDLALMMAFISIVASTAIVCLILLATSLFMAVSTPRRDHGDRSIEFWLSLPVGHGQSLATPLLVHLVLVPAAALAVGFAGGLVISLLLVTRFVGFGDWLALPWGYLLAAGLSLVLRVAAGLPLALLWISPLLLLAMLANAYFRRWGLPVLAMAVGVGSLVLKVVFGQAWLPQVLGRLGENAGLALAGAGGSGVMIDSNTAPTEALTGMPAWAWHDFVAALQALGSPLLLGALVVSAALFWALVQWRQRGAGGAG